MRKLLTFILILPVLVYAKPDFPIDSKASNFHEAMSIYYHQVYVAPDSQKLWREKALDVIKQKKPLLISIALWFFPNSVAKSILTDESDQEVKPISSSSLLSIIISCLGIFVLYYAIVDSVYWLIFYQLSTNMDNYGNLSDKLSPEVISNMWATAVELAMAIILIFKSQTIAKQILKVAT